MYYSVGFRNDSLPVTIFVDIKVKANSESAAIRNARKRGYLKRDGWEWYSIYHIAHSTE